MCMPGEPIGDKYVRVLRATADPLHAISQFVDYHPEAGLG